MSRRSSKLMWFFVLSALVACKPGNGGAEQGGPEVKLNSPPPLKESPVTPVSGMTADDIIAKYVAARGGEAKLAAVSSVRLTGRMTGGDLKDAPLVVEMKRPSFYRWKLQDGRNEDVQAYDGQTAWELAPGRDISKPARMPPAWALRVKAASELDTPLVNYQKKGYQVKLLGQETEGDRPYKLQVTFKDGSSRNYFIDPKSFLLIRSTGLTPGPMGNLRPSEILYSDYKEVGGVRWPYSEKMQLLQLPFGQSFQWDKIEVNVTLPDSQFKMPA